MSHLFDQIRGILRGEKTNSTPPLEQRDAVANATIASFRKGILFWPTHAMPIFVGEALNSIDATSKVEVRFLVARAINDMKAPDGKIMLRSYEGSNEQAFASMRLYDSSDRTKIPEGSTAIVLRINLNEATLYPSDANSPNNTTSRYWDLLSSLTEIGRLLYTTDDLNRFASRAELGDITFPITQDQ